MTRLSALRVLSVLFFAQLTLSEASAQHPAPGSWAFGPAITIRPGYGYGYGYPYSFGVHPGIFVGHYQGFYGNGLSMYGPPVNSPGPTPGAFGNGATTGRFSPGAVYANPTPRERGRWRK